LNWDTRVVNKCHVFIIYKTDSSGFVCNRSKKEDAASRHKTVTNIFSRYVAWGVMTSGLAGMFYFACTRTIKEGGYF